MINWQPKETARKDGTRILIWAKYAALARWTEECQFGQFETGPGWQIDECDDPFYSYGEYDSNVTHWAPYPEGPTDGRTEGV